MKKDMLFGLSHREKRRKRKINLLHFPVFTSKNFVILKLPEPSTDLCSRLLSVIGSTKRESEKHGYKTLNIILSDCAGESVGLRDCWFPST